LGFGRDGKRISYGPDPFQVWDATLTRQVLELKSQTFVWDCRLSSEGERLITIDKDGQLQEWDLADGRLLRHHKVAAVRWSLAISPDGHTAALA
jgi:hypothetical protein